MVQINKAGWRKVKKSRRRESNAVITKEQEIRWLQDKVICTYLS